MYKRCTLLSAKKWNSNLVPETIYAVLAICSSIVPKNANISGSSKRDSEEILVRSEQKSKLKKPACRYTKNQQTCIRKRKFSSGKRIH